MSSSPGHGSKARRRRARTSSTCRPVRTCAHSREGVSMLNVSRRPPPMGRRRQHSHDLPPHMHRKMRGGVPRYYYGRQGIALGTDFAAALRKYAELHAGRPVAGTFAEAVALYEREELPAKAPKTQAEYQRQLGVLVGAFPSGSTRSSRRPSPSSCASAGRKSSTSSARRTAGRSSRRARKRFSRPSSISPERGAHGRAEPVLGHSRHEGEARSVRRRRRASRRDRARRRRGRRPARAIP